MEGLQRPRPYAIFRESPGFRLTEELSLACVTNGQEIVDCTREIEQDETHVYGIAKYMQLFVFRIIGNGCCLYLLGRWHGEFRAFANALGPTLHDGFLFGVEAHPLLPIGMHIAKQALLPPTKAVPGHGHRNGYVDTYHPNLDTPSEFPSHIAIAGETCNAIAKLMLVDELHCGGEISDSNT